MENISRKTSASKPWKQTKNKQPKKNTKEKISWELADCSSYVFILDLLPSLKLELKKKRALLLFYKVEKLLFVMSNEGQNLGLSAWCQRYF